MFKAAFSGFGFEMADNRLQPKSAAGFKRPSSWQGFFSSSLEHSGVLAIVKRVVTGHGAACEEKTTCEGGLRSLDNVKKQLTLVLEDCRDDVVRLRISNHISSATCVMDLWLLRSDLYQCVACERGQGEAARRINSLLPLFEGWIPARQLGQV